MEYVRVARTYRLEPELVLRLEEAADRLGQSLTVFVTRALEQALGGDPGGRSGERQETVRPVQEAGSTPAHPAPVRAPSHPVASKELQGLRNIAVTSVPMYCCPIPGCSFKVTGAGAYCTTHSRKVRPCE